MTKYPLDWPAAYAPINLEAGFKTQPEHFKVTETLPFECSGEGEHHYLHIRKTGQNTTWVASELAKWASVSPRSVSYAGLKDRESVSEQWFSIQLPGKKLPAEDPCIQGVVILSREQHSKKLKRGAISRNHFEIRLTDVECDAEVLHQQIERILSDGVPNYYGFQRFGHHQDNVETALLKLSRKTNASQRSILLSSVRSYLFNQMLGGRVRRNAWRVPVIGQPVALAGSRSWFPAEDSEEELLRISQKDCSPGIFLYCQNQSYPGSDHDVIERYPDLCGKLDQFRLETAVRPCILWPGDLNYRFDKNDLLLSFSLPTGSYATSVLRELVTGLDQQTLSGSNL